MRDLTEELNRDITFLSDRYSRCSERGCLPNLHKKPIRIEPGLLQTSPDKYNRNTEEIVVLKICTSAFDNITPDSAESFLERIQGIQEPISFEILGSSDQITIQIVVQKRDRLIVENAFGAICTHSYLKQTADILFKHYEEVASETGRNTSGNMEFQFNDYYLSPPYYYPINIPGREFSRDPIDTIISILSQLKPKELGFYQAILLPANKWDWGKISKSILSMTVQEQEMAIKNVYVEEAYNQRVPMPKAVSVGKPFHPVLNETELKGHVAKALEKTRDGKPFFGVSLRMGVFSYEKRAFGILRTLTNALNIVVPGNRRFKFLTRKDYYKASIPEKLHYYIFFNRVSLREGMLLTSKELSSLVHFPTHETLEKDLGIEKVKGKRPVPNIVTAKKAKGIIIGDSPYKGVKTPVVLKHKIRAEHCHIIGSTGSGKSTLIENCVLQDIEQGTGICLMDPHGELIENHVVPKIPQECMDKVIYFDPTKTPLPINILEAKDREERSILADDLVSIFKRYTANWGPQIEEILGFGVQAILSSREGGHLGTFHKFLLDPEERKRYLKTIEDEFVLDFWHNQFPHFPNRKGAIITATRRLNQLLRSPVLQDILTQKKSAINFRDIMDTGKILLINLPMGRLGSTNAYILGSLIISRIQAAAFTRQDIPEDQRKPFYLYLDEFHNFMCQSIEECLTGTRKYALGLILAHHSLEQIKDKDKKVASAVQDIYTKICFQVGDSDATPLGKGFSHYNADELQNLNQGEAIMRVVKPSNDFEISTRYDPIVDKTTIAQKKEQLIKLTQESYGLEKNIPEDSVPTSEAIPLGQSPGSVPFQYTANDPPPTSKPAITPDEDTFLKLLADTPELLPLRDIYGSLPFGTSKCSKIQKILVEKNLIEETEVPPLGQAKRKSKILTLTPSGCLALDLPIPQGQGGSFHLFMQKIITKHAQQKGYEAIIEEPSAEGTRVDVGLTKDGRKIAVEISVTTKPGQVMSSLPFAFMGGYNEVIILFTEKRVLAETERLISESEMQSKNITLKPVHEYKSVL